MSRYTPSQEVELTPVDVLELKALLRRANQREALRVNARKRLEAAQLDPFVDEEQHTVRPRLNRSTRARYRTI